VPLINVLFLHAGEDWVRGSENALLTLFRGLDSKKIIPFLYSSNRALVQTAMADAVKAEIHPMPEIMMDGGHFRFQVVLWALTLRRLLSLIKKENIQLVYCNGGSTCQVGYYAAKLSGIPVVCHIHSPYDRRHILLYRFHLSSKAIFVSKAIEDIIRGKQQFKSQSEVVYNGVDTTRFQPAAVRDTKWRKLFSLPGDSVVFGQLSSLIRRKGIDILLRAFQIVNLRHPETRLVLVGDGPHRSDFVDLARELGVTDNVIWAGHQADPLPFYQHIFDVNILASRRDAFPLSILEAAACGLPNLGANVDGIPEAIVDYENGLLFDCESHEMLATKMVQMMKRPELRLKMGKAARQMVLERFSMDKYCQAINGIIQEQIQRFPITMSGRGYAY
jgi:glycosyltransferase involved in cell wall biosynthesis